MAFGALSRKRDVKVENLRRAALFSHCSARQLNFIATRMDEIAVPAGRQLTQEARPGRGFFLIVTGQVEATIQGTSLAQLGPGDFFGEISMMDRGPATATCTSTTPCSLLVMSHEQFRDAVGGNPGVLTAILTAMAARLRENAGAGFERGG